MQLLNKTQLENLGSLFASSVAASFSKVQNIAETFNSTFYFESRISDDDQVDFLARVERLNAIELKEFLISNDLQSSHFWLIDIIDSWTQTTHPFRNKLESIWLEWDNIASLDEGRFGISFTFHPKIRNKPETIKRWLLANIPNTMLQIESLNRYASQALPAELIHFTLMLQRENVENKFYTHVQLGKLELFYEFIHWTPLNLTNERDQSLANVLGTTSLFFDVDLSDVRRKIPHRTSVNFIMSEGMVEHLGRSTQLPSHFLKVYSLWNCNNEVQPRQKQLSLVQTRWLELKWVYKHGEFTEIKAYWGFHKPSVKLFT
ncbi:hypothetical protein PA25_35910 [Pseudoalteromonas sp. A25]|uniref:hypothetical protein n=1 Tax=Pseudoalteromonas sp. A25 TaxID=116092 RepID=UPI001260F937|nr:hypothetical protein [Pseudoalteromonas sp. A25]BBN83606.1 hypothetical protein PA25_35910 [Pseudoalteromonas sp. A25]